MNRALLALAAGLLACISTTVDAQSTPYERQVWDGVATTIEKRDCHITLMVRCWYIFFAINEAPVRQVWLLDLKVRNPEPVNRNVIEIDILHVHESDDPSEPGANEFLLFSVQYQCRDQKARVSDGFALMFDGTIDRLKEPSSWMDVQENHWYHLAGKAACDKQVQLRPTAHSMSWIGGYFRPLDASEAIRHFLWSER